MSGSPHGIKCAFQWGKTTTILPRRDVSTSETYNVWPSQSLHSFHHTAAWCHTHNWPPTQSLQVCNDTPELSNIPNINQYDTWVIFQPNEPPFHQGLIRRPWWPVIGHPHHEVCKNDPKVSSSLPSVQILLCFNLFIILFKCEAYYLVHNCVIVKWCNGEMVQRIHKSSHGEMVPR